MGFNNVFSEGNINIVSNMMDDIHAYMESNDGKEFMKLFNETYANRPGKGLIFLALMLGAEKDFLIQSLLEGSKDGN